MTFSPLMFERLAAMASTAMYCPATAAAVAGAGPKACLSTLGYVPAASSVLPRSPFAIHELLGLADRSAAAGHCSVFNPSAAALPTPAFGAAMPSGPWGPRPSADVANASTFPWQPRLTSTLGCSMTSPQLSSDDGKNFSNNGTDG